MKSIKDFLSYLRELDIKIWLDGDKVVCNAPEGVLTPSLKSSIAERKEDIIKILSDSDSISPTSPTPILPLSEKKALPLSFGQQRLWFLDRLLPDSAFYNVPVAYRVTGALDIEAVNKSLNEIIRRHEALRTIFVDDEGETVQRVIPAAPLDLPVIDLQDFPDAEKEAEFNRLINEEACLPFDLNRGPLVYAKLLRLDREDHVLLVVMHHIITDGWSMGLFFRELALLYEAYSNDQDSPLLELPIQYADFTAWQQQWLQGEVLEKQLSYWKKQLDGLGVLELPTDRPRPPMQTHRGSQESFVVSQPLTEALSALSREKRVTLFMTLLAAFQTLLYRYTGQEDIVVGSPIANRSRAEIKELIGFFVNTLVLRTDLDGNPTFRDLLDRVREVAHDAYGHQDLPFEKLVEKLQPERNPSFSPLFQVMFVLQNAPGEKLQLPGFTMEPLSVETGTAKFDLTLSLTEMDGELQGGWEYNTDLFERSTITRMGSHFQTLLEGIVTNPDTNISKLPLLTAAEEQQLVVEWNKTGTDYPKDTCIHELFEAQVEKTPDAVAVVFADRQLTYRELNGRANRLAHYLQKLGVGPEVLVGICLERSLEMIVGLLGILKAGGAYVPLDPEYPEERLSFMAKDADIQLLLTSSGLLALLPELDVPIAYLDTQEEIISSGPETRLSTGVTPAHPAYVMYTSGSTGMPKGIEVTHRNVVRLVKNTNYVTLDSKTTLLHYAPLSFDASTFEIWGALLNGGRLVVCPPGRLTLDELGRVIEANQVTTLWLTAALFHTVVESSPAMLRPVRQLLAGGDVLSASAVKKVLREQQDITLINGYGPTENTTFTCCHPMTEPSQAGEKILIGKPIANTSAHILDKFMQPVPIGVVGELYAGGDGVARGYRNRPELTAEKFIPDPFSNEPGARLYMTGDMARYRPDGNIDFLGRIDHQVKIRGFRIELGEIEAVLSLHPAVSDNVVVVQEGNTGDKRLVAYVVSGSDNSLSTTELRRFLTEKLPGYMIPSIFVMLDALPLTPSGKVDRRALPAPDHKRPDLGSSFTAPRTPIEEKLAAIWADLLGLEEVGVHDNFFELGGHSLLATQIMSQIQRVLKVELPLRSLFMEPTVAGLAEHIQASVKTDQQKTKAIEIIPRDSNLPLSFAQQRLWILDRLLPDNTVYNVPVAYRVTGYLDTEVLKKSLNEIIRRHEALRTIFVDEQEETAQQVIPAAPLELPVIDLQDFPAAEKDAEINRLIDEAACRPFDLNKGPLFYVKLLHLDREDHVLLVGMHHIITDGWSMGLFFRELALLYEAYSKGQDSPLPELPIQYADYAVWQRQLVQGERLEKQLSYWKEQLAGLGVLELPIDRPRPPMQTHRGSQKSFVISQPVTEALAALSREERVTLYMTLLAAFQTLLYRYTGQEDIAVGSPIANRSRAEIEELIGFFVNTLVMRSDLAGDPTFRDLLQRVREATLDAYVHQDLPFEKLVEELQPERNPSFSPLFQVMFVLQNAPGEKLQLPGLTMEPLLIETGTAKFDLTLSLVEKDGELQGRWEYNTDLFERSTITRMSGHFQTLLEGITANPDQHLSELSLLKYAEQQQLLVEWNATQADYPKETCIHELFEAQVERTPDAVAVVFADQQLTYGELNDRANQLAHYLKSRGVGPEVLVGICLERSLDMVVGLLGILKTGGAYVPLDPEYPEERLSFMAKDANIEMLLTNSGLLALLPELDVPIVCLDAEEEILSGWPKTCPSQEVTAENAAYVMYTSGSTGLPKGIEITHRNVVRLVKNTNYVTLDSSTILLHYAPISFDASTFEIWGALLNGGKLVVCPPGRLTLQELGQIIEELQVTTLWLTAALFHTVVENNLAMLGPVKQLLAGGDILSPAAVHKVLEERQDIILINGYGPTENTTFSCCYLMTEPSQAGGKIAIGRPIANSTVYILDGFMQPVPIGVVGELYAGGDGVARGYLNRPELIKEKFIPDPFSNEPGARLYKTGDLARYQPDGNIEFLGRIDHQVKIRGFRIELGETEAVLGQHPAVSENVVVAHQEDTGEKRLVAYSVCSPNGKPRTQKLRRFLKEKLPEYMIPSQFIFLDDLPLTPSGKVDRRALPAPDHKRPDLDKAYAAPRTPIEEKLVEIWADLLGMEQVGIHDNFFELGGYSLQAVRLFDKIFKQYDRRLPLATLFQGATIAQLASILEKKTATEVQSSIVPIQPYGSEVPLFFLHSLGEGVFFPKKLIHYLGGSHPVYCFQPTGEGCSLQTNQSIKTMAERYVEDLIRYYPTVPYCLFGYSFGGFLAFEMARQLHIRNKKVTLLAIIDTGPSLSRLRSKVEKLQYLARVMGNLPKWMNDALFHRDRKELAQRIRKKLRTAGRKIKYLSDPNKDLSTKERLEDIFEWDQLSTHHQALMETHYQALEEYNPKPYPGRMTLFRARTRPPLHSLEPDLGWGDLAAGGIDIKHVPGNHLSILYEPNVKFLVESLRDCLAKLENGT